MVRLPLRFHLARKPVDLIAPRDEFALDSPHAIESARAETLRPESSTCPENSEIP